MAAIDKQVLKDAVTRRSSYILANKETITMNQCRKLLEEDMGLPEKSLKSEKEYVKELIDKLFSGNTAGEEPAAPSQESEDDAAEPAFDSNSPKQKKARRKASEDDGSSRKRLKQKEVKAKKVKRKDEEAAPAAPAGHDQRRMAVDLGKEYGREVQKMKRICKSASITIPPSVYTRVSKEQDVADRLKALLQKHGLSEQATTDEVAQVRKDVQKQRDLEGIDMSNILAEGRGRRAAAAAPHKYTYLDNGSLSDSDADNENADEENAQPANVSPGKRKQQEKKANRIAEVSDDSDIDVEDASGSESSELSQPEPGLLDKASPEVPVKGAMKRNLALWSDDDD